MDFWAFTKKLAILADKAVDVSGVAFAKAGAVTGELLEKTADFSYDKLKTSPFTIIDSNWLDEAIALSNCVIFVVWGREDATSKSIIGRMPLLVGKAWQYSTTLKILYAEDFPAQVSALGASIPSALIYKKGVQKYILTETHLKEFIESFDITRDWGIPPMTAEAVTPSSESPTDTIR
jgi:hypothetical protein